MANNLKQHIERVEALFNEVLAKVDAKGLMDSPHSRLKIEKPEDPLYVLQWLAWIKGKEGTVEEFVRRCPAAWERLLEIMPRKVKTGDGKQDSNA